MGNDVLLILVVSIIIIFILMIASIFYVNKSVKVLVEVKHKDVEAISDTGKPPADWLNKHNKKREKILLKDQWNTSGLEKIDESARQSYIKKLEKLIKYMNKTPLVDNEDTRQIIITSLDQALKEWNSHSGTSFWNEVKPNVPPEDI